MSEFRQRFTHAMLIAILLLQCEILGKVDTSLIVGPDVHFFTLVGVASVFALLPIGAELLSRRKKD